MSKLRDQIGIARALSKFGTPAGEPLVLSRRAFLAVAGGVASGALSPTAFAGVIQEEPSIDIQPDGQGGQTLTVKVASYYTWKLSTRSFQPLSGQPRLTKTTANGAIVVELANAGIAGTNLLFNFKAVISNPGNGWQIEIKLNGHRSDAAHRGVVPPLVLEWISGQKTIEFSSPGTIPATTIVGGLYIDSARSSARPGISLSCVSLNGDDVKGGDQNRVLQPVLTGPLRLHLWFPGDDRPLGRSTRVECDSATIQLLPHVKDLHDEKTSLLTQLFDAKPAYSAPTGFKRDQPQALFTLNNVKVPPEGFALARITRRSAATRPENVHHLRWIAGAELGLCCLLSFQPQPRQADALVHFGGGGSLKCLGPGTSPRGSRLHFARSNVLGLASTFHKYLVFSGEIERCESRPPRDTEFSADGKCDKLFETDHGAFLLRGRKITSPDPRENSVWLDCRACMHTARLPVRLVRAHVPAEGASVAMVEFPECDAEITFGEYVAPLGADSEPSTGTRSPRIHFGEGCRFNAPLGGAQLVVKRSWDLFDLVFEFRSYWIDSYGGTTRLDRRVPMKYLASCQCPTLVAVFPPQHVQERVFVAPNLEEPNGPNNPPPPNELKGLKPPYELAQTMISGPTRIAMQGIGDIHEPARQVFDLTIENLTDWHDLALAVHRRALPRESDTDAQLAAVGLNKTDDRDSAKVHWRDAMLELGAARPPHDFRFITQIEAVSGLIVSPDHDAVFDMPRGLLSTDRRRVPLWSAQLNLHSIKTPSQKNPSNLHDAKTQSQKAPNHKVESCVRVIHARDTGLAFFSGDNCKQESDFFPYVASLSARDRSELLTLTSGFGLPSLRRLQMTEDAGQIVDDPKGMVFLPADPQQYTFLSRDEKPYTIKKPDGTPLTVQVRQEGILVPKPFSEYSLTLTSLKGSLRSVWEGEPPAPYEAANKFYQEALNIQSYTHRVAFGRDAFVQVTYKGFLFPLGHRAALIKVTERQFRAAQDNDNGLDPTAYLIQRNMIVCKKPLKSFPALGQPFAGREFPTSSVEMVTVVTPDIINPDNPDYSNQMLHLGDPKIPDKKGFNCENITAQTRERAFWPRTRPAEQKLTTHAAIVKKGKKKALDDANLYGYEVQFEYRVDGSNSIITSPLIFVDNTAAHDPVTMAALVQYYNGLKPEPLDGKTTDTSQTLRTARHRNILRQYAPSTQSGETSFETARWTLGASGLLGENMAAGAETFTMDGMMEGADQPPFYPVMHRAFIKMQSLDRLLGRAQGLIETRFNRLFVQHALDPSGNPAEVFLDVIAPAIDLNVSSQGESAGGVAHPNSRLAAISRKNGMVGGQGRSAPAARHARFAGTRGDDVDRLCDISAAESGQFDPAEFLGGGLADAKLLGIVPLKTVVRVVAMSMGPKLREVSVFSEKVWEQVQPNAKPMSDALKTARNAAGKKLCDALGIDPKAGEDPLGEFYPELSQRIAAVIVVLDKISVTAAGDGVKLLGRLITEIRQLLRTIEATAKNPMPEQLKEYIAKIRSAVNRLSNLCTAEGLKNFLLETTNGAAIEASFKKLLDNLASADNKLLPALQTVFDTKSVGDIVNHPEEALADLTRTFYFEAFARPLLEAMTQLSRLVNVAMGRITWSRTRLEDQLAILLSHGNSDTCRRFNNRQMITTHKRFKYRGSSSLLADLVFKLNDLAQHNVADLLSKTSPQKVVEALYDDIDQSVANWIEDSLAGAFDMVWGTIKDSLDQMRTELQAAFDRSVDQQLPADERDKAAKTLLQTAARLEALKSELLALAEVLDASLAPPASNDTTWQTELKIVADYLETVRKAIVALGQSPSPARDELLKRIKAEIQAELTRSVQRLVDEIAAFSRGTVEDIMSRLLAGSRGLAGVVKVLSAFIHLAQSGDVPLILQAMYDKLLRPNFEQQLDGLTLLGAKLWTATLPESRYEAVRNELISRLALLRAIWWRTEKSANDLKNNIARFKASIDALSTPPTVEQAKDVRTDLQAIFQERRRLLDNLQEFELAAADTLTYSSSLDKALYFAASNGKKNEKEKFHRTTVEELVTILKDMCTGIHEKMKAFVQSNIVVAVPATADKLDKIFLGLTGQTTASFTSAKGLIGELEVTAATPAAINAAYRAAIESLEERERMVVGGLTAALAAITDQAKDDLRAGLVATSDPVLDFVAPLCTLHETIAGGLQQLKSLLTDPMKQLPELIAAVTGPGLAAISKALEAVQSDTTALLDIKALLEKIKLNDNTLVNAQTLAGKIAELVNGWASSEPGLVRAASIVSRLSQSLLKGQMSAFVDLSVFKAMLEEQLLEMLPTKFNQAYDWGTTLDDFPKSNSIFVMDRSPAARSLADIQFNSIYKEFDIDTTDVKDLLLAARVSVDLRTGTREASAVGLIAPFKIRLLGDVFDMVTIGFKGATFKTDSSGGGVHCEVFVNDVQVGKQLEFIQTLQQYFNPGGTGPYVTLSLVPPAIEAGFRFCKPIITMGTLSLLNIGFSVSALLPFDQRPALFKFSFASRDLPFLISVAPYGGGGFVGLFASAKGIIGFEIQFEFGAVVAISFGPLDAQGRVTAGIYLLSTEGERVLEGFVHAMGSGQIACFCVTVDMEIRVRQENGGAMAGSARFSFSFSFGLGEISYEVTASKRIEGKKAGPMYRDPHRLLATLPQVTLRTPRRHRNWRAYREHLALS